MKDQNIILILVSSYTRNINYVSMDMITSIQFQKKTLIELFKISPWIEIKRWIIEEIGVIPELFD